MPHKRAKKSVRDSTRKSSGFNRTPNITDEMDEAPKSALRILNSMKVQADYGKRKRGELTGEEERKGKKGKKIEGEEGSKSEGDKKFDERRQKNKKESAPADNGLKIQPNESLAHFNRRVEDSLRSTVVAASRKAINFSTEVARKEKEERMAKHEANQKKGKGKEDEDGMDLEEEDEADVEARKEAKKEESRLRAEAVLQKKRDAVALDFAPKASSSAPKRLNDIVQAPPQLTLPRLSTKVLAKKEGRSEHGAAVNRLGLSPAQARILEEERERVIKHYREMKQRREYKKDGGARGGGAEDE